MNLFGPRKTSHRWAWVVSRVFDPVILIPVLLAAAVYVAITNGLRWRFLIFLLFVDALIPAAYFMFGLSTKQFSDWDLTRRQERGKLYFFTVFVHLFAVVLAYFLGKIVLFKILAVFWVLAVIFAIVTLYWKISIHAGVNAAIVAFFNHYFGWDRYWWLVLVLLLVIYARVVIKKHTWSQVLLGSTIALSWVSVGLSWFGV
jgi:hypothetical protein